MHVNTWKPPRIWWIKFRWGNKPLLIKSYTPPRRPTSTLPNVHRPNWSWSSRSTGSYSPWNERNSPSAYYNFNSFKGLMTCSSVSLLATSSLLIFLSYTAIREHSSRKRASSRNAALGRNNRYPQGYIWLVNLFIAGEVKGYIGNWLIDFVQALGSVLSAHGLVANSVMPGPYCTFQGLVLQCGLLGGAIWTFVVTLNTFLLIAGGPNRRAWVAEKSASGKGRWIICIGIWLFILFIGVFGILFIQPFHPERGTYCILPRSFQLITSDNHAGAGWCWIDAEYFWERIFFFYGINLVSFVLTDFSFRIHGYACADRFIHCSLLLSPYSIKALATSLIIARAICKRTWNLEFQSGMRESFRASCNTIFLSEDRCNQDRRSISSNHYIWLDNTSTIESRLLDITLLSYHLLRSCITLSSRPDYGICE